MSFAVIDFKLNLPSKTCVTEAVNQADSGWTTALLIPSVERDFSNRLLDWVGARSRRVAEMPHPMTRPAEYRWFSAIE